MYKRQKTEFIPPDAVLVSAENGVQMKVRLVDCVGYLVPGVLGDKEEGEERMVSTPWAEEQIPFSRAAVSYTHLARESWSLSTSGISFKRKPIPCVILSG